MQTELNKVVAALQEFYAREAFLFEKDLGERTLTHRLAVHLRKAVSGLGGRLRLRPARRAHAAAAARHDRLDRRSSRQIGLSRHRRAPARDPEQSARDRGPQGQQPPAAGARPAQAAGADRSASVVRLLDRPVPGARQEHVMCRKSMSAAWSIRRCRLVCRAAEGCEIGRGCHEGLRMKMMLIRTVVTVAGLLISGLLAEPAKAQTSAGAAPVDVANRLILADPKVVKTLEDIKADDDAAALDEQKRITEIPAPPYKEKVRAEYYPEADAGTRLQGRLDRCRRQCDRACARAAAAAGRSWWCRRISTRCFPKAPTSP